MHLEGAAKLNRQLTRLPGSVRGSVLRRAVEVGAEPIAEEMRRLVPVRRGGLRNSIGTRIRDEGPDVAVADIGPLRGPKGGGAHAHLVEFGTGPRQTDTGAYRGEMPAQPFMRPAAHNKRSEAVRRLQSELRRGILRVAR